MDIEVVDQIMGTGKSYATLRYIESLALIDDQERWIFCTEYLDEIEKRTQENPSASHLWRTPVDSADETKTERLIELLREPKSQLIAITHSLLISASNNPNVNHLLKTRGYKLFLDETIELINPYNGVKFGDFFKSLAREEITIDESQFGKVDWIVDDTIITHGNSSSTDKLKHDCNRGVIYCCIRSGSVGDSLSIVSIEKEILFTQFNRVIVATYNIQDTLFDAYLSIKGLKRIECKDVVCARSTTKKLIKDNIQMINKYNKTFEKVKLSGGWYDGTIQRPATVEDFKLINKTIKAIGDSNGCKGNAHLLGFTVPKDRLGRQRDPKKIQPVGYPHTVCSVVIDEDGNASEGKHSKALSAYVPCNARASNEYANKTVMIHLYNRYPQTPIIQYLDYYGVRYSSETFALNELIQWIWRSAIRNRQPIKLAILSKRMRELFDKWINEP